MPKSFITSILLTAATFNSYSQSPAVIKIAKECSTEDLKKNLYYLASPELEGRMIATKGDTLASRFIAEHFRKNKLVAPYNGTFFQAVKARKLLNKAVLKVGGKIHSFLDNWSLYPRTPLKVENAAVVYNQFTTLSEADEYIAKADLNGKALLLSPIIIAELMRDDAEIERFEQKCKARGIVALLFYGPRVDRSIKMIKTYLHEPSYENKELDSIENPGSASAAGGFPEVSLGSAVINELLAADNLHINADGSFADSLREPITLKTRISLSFETQAEEVIAPNVIGVLEGRDTSLPALVISAHHDHEGVQQDGLFPGAVDNASGTVAIMEIAAMMNKAVRQGQRPKRSIIFASFTGEEKGMIGSFYYANHPLKPMNKTYIVLNFDMMGRVDTFYSGKRKDSSYAYVIVMDSTHGFRKLLYAANDALPKLKLDTYYEQPANLRRRLYGSDQLPFYVRGVPFIRIDCGFSKDYHQQSDTPDKINYPLLTKQTQLAFLTVWNIANQ